jgi:hypothetical protein
VTSLTQRILIVTIQLGSGTFAESGTDTTTFSGLRATAKITRNGGLSASTLSLRVYGLTLQTMNDAVQYGAPNSWVNPNNVTVQAGDVISGMNLIFTGQSTGSWIDASGAPDVCFAMEAFENQYLAIAPANPASYEGPTNCVTILQNIATQMGFSLEDNGVNITLPDQYFSGTLTDQAQQVAQTANLNIDLDGSTKTLSVWPKFGNRDTPDPPLLIAGPGGNLVGYPNYTTSGVSVKTLFNPNIKAGNTLVVEGSLIKAANQTWATYSVTHDLSSEMPDGPWFTSAECYYPGQPQPI